MSSGAQQGKDFLKRTKGEYKKWNCKCKMHKNQQSGLRIYKK